MTISKRTILLALMLVMGASVLAHAQSATSDNRGGSVLILSTVSSRVHGTLTIRGKGFGDRTAQVWCQDYPLTVISWMNTEIVVHLPDALPDGSHLLTVIRGEGQNHRAVFDMAVQGQPTSVPGPKGDPGVKGDVGPAGPQGDIGATGLTGDTGASGATGDTGAAGPQGEPGPVGPMGPMGPAGPAGPAGPQGDTGAQGPAGAIGPVGATGPQGASGPQGPAGADGATGPQGATGPAGPAGPQGLMGFMGPQGPAGAQGPAGVSGFDVVPKDVAPSNVLPYQLLTVVVNCTGQRVAIGGGFDYSNNGATPESPILATVASFPSANTWRVVIRLNQPTAASITGRAYAICANRS